MDNELFRQTSEACKMVTEHFGIDVLSDKKRFCSAFNDFAPKLSRENKALNLALSENIGDFFLRENDNVLSGRVSADSIVKRAQTDLCDYLNDEKAELITISLAYSLGWNITVPGNTQTVNTDSMTAAVSGSALIEELFLKAQNGDNDACFNLGERFFYGRGVKQDYEKAVYWYTQSSDRGDCSSQKKLAECHHQGYGTPENDAEAVKRYYQAAEQGDYDSQKALILCYQYGGTELNKDITKARKFSERYGIPLTVSEMEELTNKAKLGDANAQLKLGHIFWNGNDETRADHEKAARLYKAAAAQDEPAALYSLACCYASGNGVPCDYNIAFDLFSKAAEHGDMDALNNIGRLYFYGDGTEQNKAKALCFFRQAADNGNPLAQYNVAECFYHGWGERKNYEKAFLWYKKAAAQSITEAIYSCGWCSFMGQGTPRDFGEAKKYFELAAQNGSTPAHRMLGYCYMNGMGAAVDFGKAAKLFETAASQNDTEAVKMLAVCLKYGGNNLDKNESRAIKLAEKFGFDYNSL